MNSMKGLLLHNFYIIMGDTKETQKNSWLAYIIACVVVFVMGKVEIFYIAIAIQIFLIVISIVGVLVLEDDSKWNRLEVTFPVKRRTIINSKYLTIIILALVGCALSVVLAVIFSLLGFKISYTDTFYYMEQGLYMAIGALALTIPLVLTYGGKISSTIFPISVVLSMIFKAMIGGTLAEMSNPTMILGTVFFGLSYIASIWVEHSNDF